ncbi:divergent CRAL/TRIO domain-containing protein [Scheffersomyces amazonensis]|uniref:divergent CRAL/TRIO domain-containing protein n=1 Tax=Scheffersomyces amazonensis TaxID=1078765 RepID=UPI00315DE5F7
MERIFYNSDVVDIGTKLPVYIFDTSYLPSTDVIDYDEFIPTLMSFVPQHPYVLIMFNCGLNKISWIWGIKFLKSFLADNQVNLQNLRKIITVHDSWFIKSITQILSTTKVNLSNFSKFIDYFTLESDSIDIENLGQNSFMIHSKTLSQLSHYIDITQLKISLNIYKHDLQVESEIQLSKRYIPLLNPLTNFNYSKNPIFYQHFYQIFNIINLYSTKTELIFHKPGNKLNTDVLFNCINRNQLIWINDWDLYGIATTFKKILMELPHPIIPTNLIPLPMKDDYNYTSQTFNNLLKYHSSNQLTENYSLVLIQLCELCLHLISNNETTHHTSLTLSKSLSHCLSHELISSQNKDNILIINRFLKNLLDNWSKLRINYVNDSLYYTVEDCILGKPELVNNKNKTKIQNLTQSNLPDTSYDLSYEITVEENTLEADDDNEVRVSVNTTTILNHNSKLSKVIPLTNNMTPIKNLNREILSPLINLNLSPNKFINTTTTKVNKALSDVSNVSLQYPPQKYKFSDTTSRKPSPPSMISADMSTNNTNTNTNISKRPVIRGRKVSELAKLYEERAKGLELLKGL